MRLLHADIPLDCEIAIHGDTHEGSRNSCKEGIKALIRWVLARRNRFAIHNGDAVEAITCDDKRFDPDGTNEPKPRRQAKAVAKQYEPIGDRMLVWMSGNHEFGLARYGDLAADIAEELGCQYGGYACKLALRCNGKQLSKFYLWHGPRAARFSSNAKDYTQRQANVAAALRRCLEAKACDCQLMAIGHTHKLIVVPPCPRLLMADDGERLHQRYLAPGDGAASYIEPDARWYVNSGSYLRTQALGRDSYAEIAGYDPIELGHAVARFEGGRLVDVRREVWRG